MSSSIWFKSSYKSLPDYFHPGSEHIASSLQELELCTVKVSSLHIYRTPLPHSVLQVLHINHHFLVVEVSAIVHPTHGDLKKGLKIRAEKTGRDENGKNTGIHVKEIHFVCEENVTRKYDIVTHDVSLPMEQLLKILTQHSADYDILNDNCWLYADNTLRALVQKFQALQPEFRDAMNESLQHLSCLIMPGKMALAAVAAVGMTTLTTVILYKTLSAIVQFNADSEGEENEE